MCETFSPQKTLTVITKQKSRAETCNKKKKKKNRKVKNKKSQKTETEIADRNTRKKNNGNTEQLENKR